MIIAQTFHQQTGHKFMEDPINCYIWSKAVYDAEPWTLRKKYQKYFESF